MRDCMSLDRRRRESGCMREWEKRKDNHLGDQGVIADIDEPPSR